MERDEFLKIVKNFSREDFKKYLYREINKKQKLIMIITKVKIPDNNKK